MASPVKIRLGEILVQQDLISADDLTKALEEQKRTGKKLG
jgi:MSHA biogenesis protein MshE